MPGGISTPSKTPKQTAKMAATRRKAAQQVKIAKPVIKKSAKAVARTQIRETQTSLPIVSKVATGRTAEGDDMIEISSDDDDDDEDEEDHMDVDEPPAEESKEPFVNGISGVNGVNGTSSTQDDGDEDEESDHEPTFGELIREQAETIDVNSTLSLLQSTNNTAAASTAVTAAITDASAASPASLGNLLNAALVTGDDANLEVCFNSTTDLTWIRNTIERLDPSLAGPLLRKLAARMHRRPGRAHTLMSWVQWTLITHGGALASQPGVTKSLQELHRVLEERARGLNSLLLLKGKLDMLEAQMQLRRAMRARALEPSTVAAANGASSNSRKRRRGSQAGLDDEDPDVALFNEAEDVDDEAGHILVNGVSKASAPIADDEDVVAEDEDDSEDSEDDDDEAGDDEDDENPEEMDDDEDDEIDFDDVDDEEDDDEVAAPPSKVQKKSSTFSKRR